MNSDRDWYEYGVINETGTGILPSALANCLDRADRNPVGGDVFLISRLCIDILITIGIFVTNIITIMAIVLYGRKHRCVLSIKSSSTSMKFVLNLAFADLCVGICIPAYLIPRYFCTINEYMILNQYSCMFKYVMASFSSMTSNYSIIAIAIDRYIAIVYPLRYRQIMTKRVCFMILGACWFAAMICSSVLFFWNAWTPGNLCDLEDVVPETYITICGVVGNGGILLIVGGIHYKLHQEATISSEKNRSRESSLSNISNCPVTNNLIGQVSKSAKTVMIVTGVYFLCWTPYSICLIIRMLQKSFSPTSDLLFQLTFPLSYANSMINPFIYSWKNAEVNSAMMWFLKEKRCISKKPDLWIRKADGVRF